MNTLKLVRTLLALALAALPLTAAVPVHAQEVAPVPAPTIIKTAPYTITAPGYYQLGANLSYAGNGSANDAIITVNVSGVTLDFGGHLISGTTNAATQLYGVYANERGDLTIKNGTIGHCFIGVYLLGNGNANSLNINQSVHDMLITNCFYAGTLLDGATNSLVNACRVSNIGGTTVFSFTVNGINLSAQGYAHGLFFAGGVGNSITNNTITNLTATNGNIGVEDDSNEVFASGNTISKLGASGTGIYYVAFAVNNTISSSPYGIYYCTKYANNLTSNCTTPFTSGTAVGYNN